MCVLQGEKHAKALAGAKLRTFEWDSRDGIEKLLDGVVGNDEPENVISGWSRGWTAQSCRGLAETHF